MTFSPLSLTFCVSKTASVRTQLWKRFGNTSGVSLYSCSWYSLKQSCLVPAPPIACPVTLEKSPRLSEPDISSGKVGLAILYHKGL